MKISNLLALTVLVFPHPVVAAGAGPLVRTVQGELRAPPGLMPFSACPMPSRR